MYGASYSKKGFQRPSWFPLHIQDSPIRSGVAIVVLAVGSNQAWLKYTAHSKIPSYRFEIGFIVAAKARGEREWPHILRNILPDIVHLGASRVVLMTGGLVILEHIFNMNEQARRFGPPASNVIIHSRWAWFSARQFCMQLPLGSDVFRLLWDPRAKWGTS